MQEFQEIDPIELAWLIERSKRITSSQVHKLFMGGRKSTEIFGLTAIKYIKEVVFQIKRGDLVDSINAKELEFGKQNEPYAIANLRKTCGMDEIVHCSEGDEITFKTALGDAFGDSPDYYVVNSDGVTYAVGEIKCPYNKVKACDAIDNWTKEYCVEEYNYQFAGHFIANPDINELHYTVYNAHVNSLNGKLYDESVTFIYYRQEFQGLIDKIEYRVERVYEFILLCVSGLHVPEDINNWWLAKEYLY